MENFHQAESCGKGWNGGNRKRKTWTLGEGNGHGGGNCGQLEWG